MTTYDTGTISVGAGSTAVTGVGTNWATSGVRAGDVLMAAGLDVIIATVNSATSITLKRPWPGGALSGANYDIRLVDDGVRSLVAANTLLQQLTNGKLTSLAAVAGAADKLPYFTGASTFGVADITGAARAILALTGASGAKLPVVTGTGAAALRDILGTVSQSGGTPTGAILERGSNADGGYVKYADGTMICWHLVTSSASAAVTWSFPAQFAAAPNIQMTVGAASPRIATYQTATSTSVAVNAWTAAGDRASVPVMLSATGRWV